MKKAMFLVILFFPMAVLAHPGKTDKYGGHQCLKGCEEWKLYYKEYHLHDKDGRPIRVSRKRDLPPAELESVSSETALPVQNPPVQSAQTVTVYRYVTTVKEETAFPFNPLLWVLLVLLLLLLILQKRKRRDQER